LLAYVNPPQVLPFPPFGTPPVAVLAQGNPDYRSEEVSSYEAGYRTTFSKTVSLDMTRFYNDYRDLRYGLQGTPSFNGTTLVQPIIFSNALSGKTYGVEIATVWQMLDWWRWDVNYSWLHTQLNNVGPAQTPISPEQRVSLRGSLSPWQAIDLDFWFRYVDSNFSATSLGNITTKGYVTLDLRAAWHLYQDIELSLVGQNLLAPNHLEYVSENQSLPTAINRGMYGKISWKF
jgi:iron complex outermembrane recepter protein